MISMSKANSIRELWRDGESVAEVARRVGVSRDTVYKYLETDDFSPKIPVRKSGPRKMDDYAAIVDQWLDDDAKERRKQRHTAHRVWVRLTTELGAEVSESTVRRYVHDARLARRNVRDGFLDLDWPPGEAQADFGEADFYVRGVRTALSYFVLSFPNSNVGLAQIFPGENAECVCQGLRNIFEYLECVPTKIVFDNAAGVGRRICDRVRTTESFAACATHYGFRHRFCNPYSGNEKGNVENKVGTDRRNLFVPVPQVWDPDGYNRRLLDACMDLARKDHYKKGEPEIQLFQEDLFAMAGLPDKPFECVSYRRSKADKKGKVKIDGRHWYSTDPAFAGREMIVALGATGVSVYDASGTLVCEHARAYGKAPTDTADPGSQLALLANRIGAWENSAVRTALPDSLRGHMDSLGKDELRVEVRLLRDQYAQSGWSATVQAAELAYASVGRLDEASVSVGAARIAGGGIDYDDPVDLGEYDAMMAGGGR